MPVEVIHKEVPVTELAPDALVFINGSDTVQDEDDKKYEIRNDITSITTSLNIDSVPGSATFSVSLPDHSIRRYGNKTYKAIDIMSEIEIYFKGRFEVTRKGGTYEYPYYPCFWGLIVSVSESYADGVNTLTFTCSDILYWWKIIRTGTNFAIVATKEEKENARKIVDVDSGDRNKNNTYKSQSIQTSVYGNRYADYTIPNALFTIAQTTVLDFMPFEQGLEHVTGETSKNDLSIDYDNISQQGKDYETKIRDTIIDYWAKRFDQIARRLRLYGFTAREQNLQGFAEYTFDFDEESWGEIRTGTLNQGSPALMETITKSKLELANELKDMIQFEFFMDVNGEIIFKPPFYNIDIRDNIVSRIEDVDIINWNFIQAESEIVTRMDVTGVISKSASNDAIDKFARRGIAIDPFLAQRFGIRIQERKAHFLSNSEECLDYAKSELDRINARAQSGTIGIIGRPELRLGYPIYIVSRDAFYYVKSIDHSFDFGGQFTTNLGLVTERTRIRDKQGNPVANRLFRSVGELKDNAVLIEGETSINEDDNNNFVKEMIIQRLCHPNVQGLNGMTRPKYIDNLASVKISGAEAHETVQSDSPTDDDRALTDGDGYELIGLFKYGRNLVMEDNVLVKKDRDKESTKAKDALGVSIGNKKNYFSPNNSALSTITLDENSSSMLIIQSDDLKVISYRAQNLTPQEERKA